jgi:choline dehydrogenase-like flavoprotein
MIIDLNRRTDAGVIEADIVLVGAGVAGLILADRLRGKNKRVIVLESGDRAANAVAQELNNVEHASSFYNGATAGRVRCLGGTSTIWGGALLPFRPEDMQARPHMGLPAWPVQFAEVEHELVQVESTFQLPGGSFDSLARAPKQPTPANEDFTPRFAKWPRFALRNLSAAIAPRLESDPDCHVWLNATASGFELDREAGRITAVTAKSLSGNSVRIRGGRFVLCAGAIETTRQLLWLDAQNDNRPFQACDALGRYFHDHVSSGLAHIETDNPTLLNRLAGFQFEQGAMRALRYEFSPHAQAADEVSSGFAHFAFAAEKPGAFDAIRDFLRSVQRRQPAFDRLVAIAADAPYLINAACWRLILGQLYWPRPARYELHVVAEQKPDRANCITLSQERDKLAVPRARIDWRVRDAEVRTFRAFARRFERFWEQSALANCGTLRWRTPPEHLSFSDFASAGDVFHPGGTTRMGIDKASSVVDGDLTVHGITNLSIASTSVFPAGAAANPTLMLILFCGRLADRLARAA